MLTYGNVVGQFVFTTVDGPDEDTDADIYPLRGSVTFAPSTDSLLTSINGSPMTVKLAPVIAQLDSNGQIDVSLIATDNEAVNPVNFTYNVTFNLSFGSRVVSYRSFNISVPTDSVVDLTTVTPVAESNGVPIIRGEPGPAGTGIEILGSVATETELPATGNATGDTYIAEDTNQLHLWDGDSWSAGFDLKGEQGLTGQTGESAYELAVAEGFSGSLSDWLTSLKGEAGLDGSDGSSGSDGRSAYELAVAQGFVGTEAEWIASLKGPKGDTGTSTRITGVTATTVAAGTNAGVLTGGTELERTIQFMIPRGNTGSQGPAGTNATITGATATELPSGSTPTVSMGGTSSARTFAFGIPAGPRGADGNDGLPGTDGSDGASAYEVAVANGFVGTESQWLESLKGADGTSGEGTAYDDTELSNRVSAVETNKLSITDASNTYATKTELSDGLATKINSSTVTSNYLSKADAASTYATKADEEARPRIYTGTTTPVNPRAGDIWVK